jgi:predicted Zn-dependent protease
MRWLKSMALAGLLMVPGWTQVSVAQEVALGQRAAQQIEAETGLDNNPELNARLQRIGQQLVRVCGRNDFPYSFKVLNSDEFNAMALPGGFVYATRKLMQSLPDHQLAFVIGHELTHVTQRHSIRQMENDQRRRLGILAVLYGLSGGQLDSRSAQLAGVVDQVFSSRFSQQDEDEADRLGTEMMARAGVDPANALLALRVLAAQHDGGMPKFVNAILGSHPLPQERIAAAFGYIPRIQFGTPLQSGTSPAVTASIQDPKGWLAQGLQQNSLHLDQQLEAQSQSDFESARFDEGVLLYSPANESIPSLERRLYANELSRKLRENPRPSRFGLTLREAAGHRLLWVRLK